jgi:hypothetical protein
MSSIWTPSGERPVGPEEPSTSRPTPAADPHAEEVPSDEELTAELEEALQRLARTPAAAVVTNHVLGLFELGRLHLAQDPPNFVEAQLAIDAMAGVVEGLGERLGDATATLRDALAQIRLAFVQLRAAGGAQPDDA